MHEGIRMAIVDASYALVEAEGERATRDRISGIGILKFDSD